MSSTAQFHFAAEFVTFLAAASGLALVLLRGELLTRSTWGRYALGSGFLGVAAAAFLRGSLVFKQVDPDVFLVVRALGLIALAAGSLNWNAGEGERRTLWLGISLVTLSLVVDLFQDGSLVDVTLLIGAIGIGVSALVASRRSIAARVAASAAVALLMMVLVLSLSLSAVLIKTVEDEALRRLDERALTEVSQIGLEPRQVALNAGLAGQVLAQAARADLVNVARQPGPNANIGSALETISTKYTDQLPLAYITPSLVVIAFKGYDAQTWQELSRTDVVQEVLKGGDVDARATVDVAGGRAVAMAVQRVRGINATTLAQSTLGLVVAAEPLDRHYLELRARGRDLSLTLADRTGILARAGQQAPPPATVKGLAQRTIESNQALHDTTANRFLSLSPVTRQDKRPVMALVASESTGIVTTTRDQLFTTLFLIALGGTMLALVIAALVGDRIGSGVRRLTLATERLQQGDLAVRAEVEGQDEVGSLAVAFNSMAASIEEKTSALRQAADDETRLRNRLEAVVAGMGEALVAVDASGHITDFNQAAEELIGVSAERARGKAADAVIHLMSDDGDDLSARLRRPLPRRWSVTGSVRQPDNTQVPVALSAGALRGPAAEMAGGVFVIRDLRREREVERMKTEFLSHIGHELRTPLAGILGHSEILVRKQLPPDRARVSQEEILKSGRRLERVVEMLEFFASTGAGRVRLRREPVNVKSVVQDAVDRWSDKVNGDHPIGRRVARGVPEVDADPRWLALSLDELLDNAVKFSPNGGKITVTAAPTSTGRRTDVEITVTDKGKGMTPDEQSRAFSDFVQGDGSDTRSYGGLGLGLALVKRVADAHGGEVRLESTPGKGSKLSIVLPGAPKKRRR
ncbi:MAG: two-component system, OmpR family, sensor histidine kinase VicK [Actinomycetota bacterium]|nr:two-component system, OmpR family, sensor histidine kinase VicK [Actinomycetota bacterium]